MPSRSPLRLHNLNARSARVAPAPRSPPLPINRLPAARLSRPSRALGSPTSPSPTTRPTRQPSPCQHPATWLIVRQTHAHTTHLVARANTPDGVGSESDAGDRDGSVASPVPGTRPPAAGRAPHFLGVWVLCLRVSAERRARHGLARVGSLRLDIDEQFDRAGRPPRQRSWPRACVYVLTPPPCMSAGDALRAYHCEFLEMS